MKIIDAYWEKRNLGANTVEIILDKDDDGNKFTSFVNESKFDYYVVKMPTDAINFNYLMIENGFIFSEAMNHIYHDLDLNPLSGYKKEVVEGTVFEKITNMEVVYKNIENGMFKTDRISLDPLFGEKKSAFRYINWIQDELDRGSELYRFIYKGNDIGFIGFKEKENKVFHDFISGIYKPYLGKGLAVNMTYKLVEEVKNRGGVKLTTDISSNNVLSLKSRINNGFNFEYTNYVFVKHKHNN